MTTEIETEPWGEQFFQVTHPNGVVLQLVRWITGVASQVELYNLNDS